MIRTFTLFLFLTFFLGIMSFGQTASLGDQQAVPNTTTAVALTVGNFNGINSLTFNIRYDPAVLSFNGISSSALTGMTANATDSTIHIFWSAVTPQTVSGVLCNLDFVYNGTTSSLGFLPTCTVTQAAANMLVGYTNGSVSPDCSSPDITAIIGTSPNNIALSTVIIPVTYSDYGTEIGAVTQKIKYDATRLSYDYTEGLGIFSSGLNASASNGIITITWTKVAGAPIVSANDYINLHFVYNAPGTALIQFAPGCVVTASAMNNVIMCYTDGAVTQAPTIDEVKIESASGIVQGNNYTLPLEIKFNSGIYSVDGFTFYLHFDSQVMSFQGIETGDPLSALVVANATGSTITLVYVNTNGDPIPVSTALSPFLKLKFHYTGMGTAHVNFLPGSQIVDDSWQILDVNYVNSVLTPGIYPPYSSVTIGSVMGVAGSQVLVPVYVDGSSSNPLGAVTMFIGYDNTRLTFTGISDNSYNASYYASSSQIGIAWTSPYGTALNGQFLTLNFHYNGGGGNTCAADIWFKNDDLTKQPCELANAVAAYVPSNWIDGGVNLYPAAPVINGIANPFSSALAVPYSTDGSMINYNWSVTGGTIASGNSTSAITVNWGAAGAGTVAVSYTNPGGCNVSNSKAITIINATGTAVVSGYVTYDNGPGTGMNTVKVYLTGSNAVVHGPYTTSTNVGNGYYTVSLPYDDYTVSATLSATWAGASAVDALITELYTAGYVTLAPLRYKAANVNGLAPVNATDALLIKQRIVGAISSFPAGDWVFEDAIVHAFSGSVSGSFKGICTGDVNGSDVPSGVKSVSSIASTEDEIMTVQVNKSFTYDLRISQPVQLGAMTLFLGYNQDLFEVEKLNTSLDGMSYTINNGRIAIAWSNLNARQLQANDAVISLQMKARRAVDEPVRIFAIQQGSEFGDPGANVLTDMNLKLSKVVTGTTANNFSVFNYPNPFVNSTTLVYQLPAAGEVHLIITDLYGKQVATLVNGTEEAGMHTFSFVPGNFNMASGVYLYKLELKTGTDIFTKFSKMVYTR